LDVTRNYFVHTFLHCDAVVMPRLRWTPEEKKRLLDLIAAGKSWTLISATLKRSMKAVKLHAKTLRRAGAKKKDCP
jgi:DNA-binding NarL/FixJ family response regulator